LRISGALRKTVYGRRARRKKREKKAF